jgi:membrane protein DedA with SNARE-associated domain
MHSELPGFLGALAPLLTRYGYLALFAMIGVESFGVPAPGQSILIAAAVFAGLGRLNLPLVALVAFLAATIGDNVGYAIGRYGGRRLVNRFGRYVGLTETRLDRLGGVFERQGPKLVVLARFVDGFRQFNGVLSGLAGMRWTAFCGYNALGAALWVGIWTAVGRLAGHHIVAVYQHVQRYQLWVLAALVLLAAALVTRHLIRRRRASANRTEQPSPEPTSPGRPG